MPETDKEKLEKLRNLSPEDKRNLVGFFALLIKVDKRINPALYTKKALQNNVRYSESAYPNGSAEIQN